MVYLTSGERELLERLVDETGLSRTELLRRGLRSMADELMEAREPGSAFDHLLASAEEGEAPGDLSERADHYLYGGGYEAWRTSREESDGGEGPRRRPTE
jgi:hypothetical protein